VFWTFDSSRRPSCFHASWLGASRVPARCRPARRWNHRNREQRIFRDFRAQPRPVAFSGSTAARESRPTRRFHHFSTKYGNMPDCMAERSGFELPVPLIQLVDDSGLTHHAPCRRSKKCVAKALGRRSISYSAASSLAPKRQSDGRSARTDQTRSASEPRSARDAAVHFRSWKDCITSIFGSDFSAGAGFVQPRPRT